ncbi:helix-hairpin-helix domain-containing protein [Granulicatella adiacens]|jgi:competence protein comEA helix-hairpin-helix repeat region|uniref:helix-hairpin-helix domain-containing protein n=1 Tax=Granulicatella adiacens TaxID=46124 RepID=UPI001C3C889E|nr:helix-hairpin-helix domain-containing protein [Granulicatella adiacens]MCT2159921.1 helix-hairpin-helix domain-containing protein [Granulicatella adiacens]
MAFFDAWKDKWEEIDWKIKVGVLFVCLIIGMGLFWMSRQGEEVEEAATSLAETTILPQEVEDKTTVSTVIYVDVKGEIHHPGVYQMKAESRVKDLIEAAGGFTPLADDQKLNLAQLLEDQMVIVVPKKGEEVNSELAQAPTSQKKEVGKEGKVNINTATVEELKTLKGIGEKKAEAIIEYRKKNGSFKNKEELMKVRGIGKKLYESFQERVIVQ